MSDPEVVSKLNYLNSKLDILITGLKYLRKLVIVTKEHEKAKSDHEYLKQLESFEVELDKLIKGFYDLTKR